MKICHELVHSVPRRVRAVYLKFWRTYYTVKNDLLTQLDLVKSFCCIDSVKFSKRWVLSSLNLYVVVEITCSKLSQRTASINEHLTFLVKSTEKHWLNLIFHVFTTMNQV